MIPCAVAKNIQTMLVARFLDGLAGSAFLSVAGGTVGDLFARHVSRHPLALSVLDDIFHGHGHSDASKNRNFQPP